MNKVHPETIRIVRSILSSTHGQPHYAYKVLSSFVNSEPEASDFAQQEFDRMYGAGATAKYAAHYKKGMPQMFREALVVAAVILFLCVAGTIFITQ